MSPEKSHTVSQSWYCLVTTLLALPAAVNCILKTASGKVYRIPLECDLWWLPIINKREQISCLAGFFGWMVRAERDIPGQAKADSLDAFTWEQSEAPKK